MTMRMRKGRVCWPLFSPPFFSFKFALTKNLQVLASNFNELNQGTSKYSNILILLTILAADRPQLSHKYLTAPLDRFFPSIGFSTKTNLSHQKGQLSNTHIHHNHDQMASPIRPAKIPLSFDWGSKVSPGRNGSPNRHQWHTWKHGFSVNTPPRDPKLYQSGKLSLTQTLEGGAREEMKMSLTTEPEAGLPPVIPRWAIDDKLVLRFFGFFKETVNDSSVEISRIRPVALLCWPLDGTMQLNELRVANSGMPAGTMIKRSMVQKVDCTCLTLDEIRLGGLIEIYGKVIKIVNCDGSTRRFFSTPSDPNAVDRLGEPLPMEEDKYSKNRYAFDRPNEAPRFIDHDFKEYLASQSGAQHSKIDRGDFNRLDGQELRFKCFWNNEGIHTDLLLRYFLSTSEMMVMELGTFEGKDPFPTLFKRGQLPLDWRAIGAEPGGLPRGTLCYGPDQFRLGQIVDLYGRQVKLMKCDDFTRIWFDNKGRLK